jgi:integrase
LAVFEALHGNKVVESLEKPDFQLFVKHLAETSVGGKSIGSIRRPMSEQTVQKRLGFLRSAINLAMHRGLIPERQNPASAIRVKAFVSRQDPAVMPKKRGFKTEELNAIFCYPWFSGCKSASETHAPGIYRLTGAEYWAPVVALYTGCRASELGGLAIGEIHIDGPNPHIEIRDNEFRRTKGGYARNVPILDALINIGFREYYVRVAASGASRLFPDWKDPSRSGADAAWSNARIIRSFNRTVIASSLSTSFVPGSRQPVTFHSFRGSFKTMLDRHNIGRNIINEVVGHSKTELDESYIGTIPIEVTYPAIRHCDFPGLILPRI